ncbi:hypothetical protein LEL_06835 [Akanthomyces lecanii RCEF 1005]|uniref:Uncharacterized protein n=1 Tax=Akanthomyces lecanii RCEF 1005 TaxID=1081108 RepID=A0A168F9E0_CORDF|nr:hypothetical protein LEL_06835 [Akanthomyces lecanii RCEF 1005]
MESKAPTTCRLCNISLASPSVWRQHAKSDLQYVAHPDTNNGGGKMLTNSTSVYNLRVKVAEPGTVITPPSSSPRRQASAASSRHVQVDEDVDDSESNYESADEDPEPTAGLQYNPHQCLFCSTESTSFDDSLQHMSKMHSFTIPHQERLVVDVETIAAYLHLVIYGYRECIRCGCRRRSVEGIQHHMTAKGHCRFDIVSDMEEFYNMPSQNYTADGESLLLPSGKLLSNPTKASGPLVSRTPRSSTRRRMALTTLPTSASKPKASSAANLPAEGSGDAPLSSDTQLSRLAKGDQQSLSHLQDYQVRSLVATGARAVDEARREAKHSELKLSKAGNVTLMGTFRADTSKRFRGPWG